MSLWYVDDQATRQWMRALYVDRLQKKLSTAEAVRDASLTVLRARRANGRSTHPSTGEDSSPPATGAESADSARGEGRSSAVALSDCSSALPCWIGPIRTFLKVWPVKAMRRGEAPA
jgi:hypothetical protein